MADAVRLRIDLLKLAANLSPPEGAALSEHHAEAFLVKNDFSRLGGDVWACEELSLGLLDQSEILELERRR